MRLRRRLLGLAALALVTAAAAAQTPGHESLQDAWWTGPILAPSAGTLPQGHMLVEPYFYSVDAAGTKTYGSLSYVEYGLTNRLTVGAIPTVDYETVPGGPNSSGLEPGDIALAAQYGLRTYHEGSWEPTMALNVQETLPSGKYNNLGSHIADGFGAGTYTTTVALYTQTYFWLPTGRILRMRLNVSQAWSTSALLEGASVYGTQDGFQGTVKPGGVTFGDLAGEYSLSQHWVLAMDVANRYSGRTWIRPTSGSQTEQGASNEYIVAPAMEYNFSAALGVIFGTRLIEAGHNFTPSVTPVVAINFVH